MEIGRRYRAGNAPGRCRSGKLCMRSTVACDGPRHAGDSVLSWHAYEAGVMAHKAAVDGRGPQPTGRSCRGRARLGQGARGSARGRVLREEAEAARSDAVSPPIPGVISSIPDDYVQLMTI